MTAKEKNELSQMLKEHVAGIVAQNENLSGELKGIKDDIQALKISNATHALNCHQEKRIKAIEENLMEYNMVKKYPKATGVFALTLIIISIYSFLKSIIN